ncbi:hypothetical protein HYC85_005435 [Camellia sinensis]|uniref:Large ribosomal subunit protein bL25 beta domain-containing protein n=1 Tax=Camellia sinensis TaxID=4442 RepID=A0A7J7HZI4_CAMSI|nr:hypothetical protein HYC85_005435 [Camellia sinensis]
MVPVTATVTLRPLHPATTTAPSLPLRRPQPLFRTLLPQGVGLVARSPDALVLCVWVSLFVVMLLSALMLETDMGGTLNRIRTTLKYLCPAEHIPPKIEVDISNLDIEDKVFMHDIEVHPSLKLLSKDESIPICKVVATTLENSKPPL